MQTSCRKIMVPGSGEVYYTGPLLDEGPYPALFYFSLSGEESLCRDPYHQPAALLSREPMRIFSLSLPFHKAKDHEKKIMSIWAEELKRGHDFITEFLDRCVAAIRFLENQGWIAKDRLAAAGLSRGGWIASHLAATEPSIQAVLGFAPITELTYCQDFTQLTDDPLASFLNLQNHIDKLTRTRVRFYIGNRDLRVGTACCFQFIEGLAEASFTAGNRSPQAELIVFPSIGHKGHGTPPNIFRDGADWIKNFLLS